MLRRDVGTLTCLTSLVLEHLRDKDKLGLFITSIVNGIKLAYILSGRLLLLTYQLTRHH